MSAGRLCALGSMTDVYSLPGYINCPRQPPALIFWQDTKMNLIILNHAHSNSLILSDEDGEYVLSEWQTEVRAIDEAIKAEKNYGEGQRVVVGQLNRTF